MPLSVPRNLGTLGTYRLLQVQSEGPCLDPHPHVVREKSAHSTSFLIRKDVVEMLAWFVVWTQRYLGTYLGSSVLHIPAKYVPTHTSTQPLVLTCGPSSVNLLLLGNPSQIFFFFFLPVAALVLRRSSSSPATTIYWD